LPGEYVTSGVRVSRCLCKLTKEPPWLFEEREEEEEEEEEEVVAVRVGEEVEGGEQEEVFGWEVGASVTSI